MITEVTWYKAIHNSLVYHVTSCDQSQLSQYFSMVSKTFENSEM
ncbi:unnamed protein product [Staurois parvus]|uniref:Uncharacterized protein n=1 Tax=Staurois parvus TaxID=386267 RepID=A0ABN9CJ49_9NEOB|nr:unnamed protein product [Staurois parvus]